MGIRSRLLLLVAVGLFLVAGGAQRLPDFATILDSDGDLFREQVPRLDSPAPNFRLVALTGQTLELEQFRGNVILLNFWATWCKPCRLEMPSMERLYQEFKAQGFTVIGVSSDLGGAQVVRPYAEALGLTFPIVIDRDFATNVRYGVQGLPTTFVIDRAGRVANVYFGARDWASAEARALILKLLEERA